MYEDEEGTFAVGPLVDSSSPDGSTFWPPVVTPE
jgi:hypothetical protein